MYTTEQSLRDLGLKMGSRPGLDARIVSLPSGKLAYEDRFYAAPLPNFLGTHALKQLDLVELSKLTSKHDDALRRLSNPVLYKLNNPQLLDLPAGDYAVRLDTNYLLKPDCVAARHWAGLQFMKAASLQLRAAKGDKHTKNAPVCEVAGWLLVTQPTKMAVPALVLKNVTGVFTKLDDGEYTLKAQDQSKAPLAHKARGELIIAARKLNALGIRHNDLQLGSLLTTSTGGVCLSNFDQATMVSPSEEPENLSLMAKKNSELFPWIEMGKHRPAPKPKPARTNLQAVTNALSRFLYLRSSH